MALQIETRTMETERLVGARDAQTLVRAEALVPGAGRDAIEPLLADASLYIDGTDLQTDRIVVEGNITCQAVYRQGEEVTLRALTARTTLSHVIEIPGAESGMQARVWGEVSHVDARYENGHMVFRVACTLKAQVTALTPVEVLVSVEGGEGIQTAKGKLESVKLAAESEELALLKGDVALPASLDARAALMDRAVAQIDAVEPDLGGVRVKGRVLVEMLVSSGAAGCPAALVRVPLALDQLVELPEWLAGWVFAEASLRSLESRVEAAEGEGGDAKLCCEAEVRVRICANATDSAEALTDLYATKGRALDVGYQTLELCSRADRISVSDTVRGTLLIGENAPGVGAVIAAQVHPSIGEWRGENGQGYVEGVLEARVLYMPGGSDQPAAAESEMPFSLKIPVDPDDASIIDLQVLGAEANALMSDRLEMKVQLAATCETRHRTQARVVENVEEGEPIRRNPGIIVAWPDEGEDAWTIGRRYGVPAGAVGSAEPRKPVILKL